MLSSGVKVQGSIKVLTVVCGQADMVHRVPTTCYVMTLTQEQQDNFVAHEPIVQLKVRPTTTVLKVSSMMMVMMMMTLTVMMPATTMAIMKRRWRRRRI